MAGPPEKSQQRSKVAFTETLCTLFTGNFMIVGLGSPIRRDDQAGLIACDELARAGVDCVKCEFGLENCIDAIVDRKPRILLIIDAVLYNGGKPGEIVLTDYSSIDHGTYLVTTHSIPLDKLVSYLRASGFVEDIYIIGVYPKDIDIGLEVSFEVKVAIDELVWHVRQCLEELRKPVSKE